MYLAIKFLERSKQLGENTKRTSTVIKKSTERKIIKMEEKQENLNQSQNQQNQEVETSKELEVEEKTQAEEPKDTEQEETEEGEVKQAEIEDDEKEDDEAKEMVPAEPEQQEGAEAPAKEAEEPEDAPKEQSGEPEVQEPVETEKSNLDKKQYLEIKSGLQKLIDLCPESSEGRKTRMTSALTNLNAFEEVYDNYHKTDKNTKNEAENGKKEVPDRQAKLEESKLMRQDIYTEVLTFLNILVELQENAPPGIKDGSSQDPLLSQLDKELEVLESFIESSLKTAPKTLKKIFAVLTEDDDSDVESEDLVEENDEYFVNQFEYPRERKSAKLNKTYLNLLYLWGYDKDGYCPYDKSNVTSKTIVVTNQTTIEDFDIMLEKGFIPDGDSLIIQDPYECSYIYRHIRADINGIQKRKSQKKALRRWNEFLEGKRSISGKERKVRAGVDAGDLNVVGAVRKDYGEVKEWVEGLRNDLNELFGHKEVAGKLWSIGEQVLAKLDSRIEEEKKDVDEPKEERIVKFSNAKSLDLVKIAEGGQNGSVEFISGFFVSAYWALVRRIKKAKEDRNEANETKDDNGKELSNKEKKRRNRPPSIAKYAKEAGKQIIEFLKDPSNSIAEALPKDWGIEFSNKGFLKLSYKGKIPKFDLEAKEEQPEVEKVEEKAENDQEEDKNQPNGEDHPKEEETKKEEEEANKGNEDDEEAKKDDKDDSKDKEKKIEKLETPNLAQFDPDLLKPREFTMTLKASKFTQEKYELYALYNTTIHKKDIPTKKSFESFLCSKNLIYKHIVSKKAPITKEESKKRQIYFPETLTYTNEPWEYHTGTYHLELRLDGELFGVLVQTFTHSGLISAYFFYNPIFKPLTVGIVSAMLELEILKKKHEYFPEFKYYYLLTYIPQVKALQYKVDFGPLEVFCAETRRWIPYSKEVGDRLEDRFRVRVAADDVEVNYEDCFEEDLLGYLAQAYTVVQPIDFKRSGGYRAPTGRTHFDLKKLRYETYDLHLGMPERTLSWWDRKMVRSYEIVRGLGVELAKRVYWDVNNVIKDSG